MFLYSFFIERGLYKKILEKKEVTDFIVFTVLSYRWTIRAASAAEERFAENER